jgi:hypothetical protein
MELETEDVEIADAGVPDSFVAEDMPKPKPVPPTPYPESQNVTPFAK